MSEVGTTHASPGTVIAGRYEIERLIARGGMAAVYLAQQRSLRRKVALKILSPPRDAADLKTFEERFRLEAETLASFDHPNIVTLYDYGEVDEPTQLGSQGRFFLAMEYIKGPRLADMLVDGALPAGQTVQLMAQVCRALRYAHRRGIVHRDLKPSNLLVKYDDDGEPMIKVVDFGLVKLKDDDQSITRAGMILGSPHCMAPEQIRGEPIDHRADIYAVGILLFRCLTGSYPFHGSTSTATMIAHLNDPIPSFQSIDPSIRVPRGLEEVVARCLEKEQEDRYADMVALFQALRSVMSMPMLDDGPMAQSMVVSQAMVMNQSLSMSDTPVPGDFDDEPELGEDDLTTEIDPSQPTIEKPPAPRTDLTRFWVASAGALLVLGLVMMAVVLGVVLGSNGLEAPAATQPAPVEPITPPLPAPPEPEPEPTEDTDASDPDPSDDPSSSEESPDGESETEPKPAPKPRPRPRPKPKPEPEPDAEAPEGYLEMPDDLFGEEG